MINLSDRTMTTPFHPLRPHQQPAQGLSLIELLIAIVISMVALVVMLNLFRDTEGSRRITGTTADAQINMQIALASMERDAKGAGVGLTNTDCKDITYIDSTGSLQNEDKNRPVIIEPDGASGNVKITFNGATSSLSVFSSKILNEWQRTNSPASVDVENIASFARLYDTSTSTNRPLAMIQQKDHCIIARMTKVTESSRTIEFNSSGEFSSDPTEFADTTDYPTDSGSVSALGGFTSYQYSVNSEGTLIVQNMMLTNAPKEELLRNVKVFRAQYGVDENQDGILDSGFVSHDAAGVDWTKVKNNPSSIIALRIVIVVQGEQFDKEAKDAATPTPVTTSVSWWDNSADNTLTLTGDDQYFRYRVLEAVIPLRNAIWSQ